MNTRKKHIFLSLLLPFLILVNNSISKKSEWIETYFSNGIYPKISTIFRAIFGWLPISFGDILYFLIGVYLLVSVWKLFKEKFKKLGLSFLKIGAFLSIFYFLFHFLWGYNYHRKSLFETLNLEKKEYTVDELVALSEDLIEKTKKAQLKITKNDTLKVTELRGVNEILKETSTGYKYLNKEIEQFKPVNSSIKKSIFSLPLTFMGFSGYLNPFTGEAQVNSLIPKHKLPMVASHEVAHQLGYASESEANFVGFLAATHHPDAHFNYSAYLYALRYAISATRGKDSAKAKELIKKIPKGVLTNIKESEQFWQNYQNKAEPFFKLFYDNYLKANQQKDGIRGYSNMVGLLVAYREKYEL